MSRFRAIAGVVVTIAAMGIAGAFAFHNLQKIGPDAVPESKFQDTASVEEPKPKPKLNPNGSELVVRTFTIGGDGDHAKETTFTGTLQPRYVASIGFRIAGKILERNVELGQRIRKGDVLFRLDPVDSDLQLRVAESDHVSAKSLLTQATAEERRQAQLRSSGSSSQAEHDLAIATLAVASARLESADRRLALANNQRAYCDLLADADGLVLAIEAEAGQVVNIGQPVLQVMQKSELEAVVNLPEGYESELRKSQATVRFWSRKNIELRAELREISPVANPVSRTYDAKFRLLESADELAIGMTATVVLRESQSDGIEVPMTSISKRGDTAVVWRVLEDHRVEAIPVELVRYKSATAVVRGPLTPGTKIVSAGVQRIDENVTVRVWEGS